MRLFAAFLLAIPALCGTPARWPIRVGLLDLFSFARRALNRSTRSKRNWPTGGAGVDAIDPIIYDQLSAYGLRERGCWKRSSRIPLASMLRR